VQRLLCVDIDDEPADNPYGSATTTLPSKQITHETMHRNLLQMLHAERRVVRVVIKQLLVQAGPEFAQRLLASLPVMGASTTPPPSLPTDLIVVDGGGGVRAAVEELREQLELAHQAELEKVENFQRVKQDLERQIQGKCTAIHFFVGVGKTYFAGHDTRSWSDPVVFAPTLAFPSYSILQKSNRRLPNWLWRTKSSSAS
jgi:hypothetical protein